MRGSWLALAAAGCGGELDGELIEEKLVSPVTRQTYTYATYVHPDVTLGPGTPWLLVTDGDIAMEVAAEALDRELRRGRIEPIVLVSIGNQATRDRDLTPMPETAIAGSTEWDPDWGGGIVPFFTFVDTVVVPKAETELGIGGEPEDRGLFGHSLGGLATLWASTFDRATFRRFASSSPSLWWDAGVALEWERPTEPPVDLLLTVGTVEVPPMIVLFDTYVDEVAQDPAITLSSDHLYGSNHFTAPPRAIEEALVELFPAEGR